jgi:hypothetical protein
MFSPTADVECDLAPFSLLWTRDPAGAHESMRLPASVATWSPERPGDRRVGRRDRRVGQAPVVEGRKQRVEGDGVRFSTSSNSTTEYGLRRTASGSWRLSSEPT